VIGTEDGVDFAATERLRRQLRDARTGDEPFFDRGPGYPRLSGGPAGSEYDYLGSAHDNLDSAGDYLGSQS
jgi:N-methylhydantoinase B